MASRPDRHDADRQPAKDKDPPPPSMAAPPGPPDAPHVPDMVDMPDMPDVPDASPPPDFADYAAVRLLSAIRRDDVDATSRLLDCHPELATAPLSHRVPRRCRAQQHLLARRHADTVAEPALLYAAKLPVYKSALPSSRRVSPDALAIMELLVSRGASLPPDPRRDYLAETCAHYDSPEVLSLLCRAGARLDRGHVWAPGGFGTMAARRGLARIVDHLLELGIAYEPFADGLPHGSLEDVEDPVVHAAQSGHDAVVDVLLRRFDRSLLARSATTAHDCNLRVLDALLLAATDRIQPKDESDARVPPYQPWLGPLRWLSRQEQMVHRLLDAGARPDATDSAGRTAAQCACRWAGPALVLRMTTTTHGGLDQRLPYIDWQDKTSYALETIRTGEKVTYLHIAAGYHNAAAVQCLLEAGARLLCDEYGRTPLHWCSLVRDAFVCPETRQRAALSPLVCSMYGAWGAGRLELPWSPPVDVVAVFLRQPGADLDRTDNFGRTALHFAAQNCYWEVMAILVRRGASPRIQDENGHTAFHAMVSATRLLPEGVDRQASILGLEMLVASLRLAGYTGINVADLDGQTPLHQACEAANVLMVGLLVALGADPDVRDAIGWTPLCCAAGSQCQDRGERLERVSLREAAERREKAMHMKTILLNAGADESLLTDADTTAADIDEVMARKLGECVTRCAEGMCD